MKRRLASALTAAIAALLLAPPQGAAQCPQTTLGEIEQDVMCPICGTPLALATEAPQAERQRAFIIERIEDCQSEDEIKAALVDEFGEGVLATPGDDGFDVAYLLPAAGALAAAAGIGVAAVRWRRRRAPGGTTATAPAPGEDERRLERDLERYDL